MFCEESKDITKPFVAKRGRTPTTDFGPQPQDDNSEWKHATMKCQKCAATLTMTPRYIYVEEQWRIITVQHGRTVCSGKSGGYFQPVDSHVPTIGGDMARTIAKQRQTQPSFRMIYFE
jgi:hypothetical protein